MTGKDLINKLKKDGWVLAGINGSHHFLEKDGIMINVPVHGTKDLKKGTLHQILKQAGMK